MSSVQIDRNVELVGVKLADAYAQRIAQAGAAQGRQISPRGPTGRYRRSWRIRRKTLGWWQIYNTDFAKHMVEWGSRNNRAYRPMGQVRDWLRAHGQELL